MSSHESFINLIENGNRSYCIFILLLTLICCETMNEGVSKIKTQIGSTWAVWKSKSLERYDADVHYTSNFENISEIISRNVFPSIIPTLIFPAGKVRGKTTKVLGVAGRCFSDRDLSETISKFIFYIRFPKRFFDLWNYRRSVYCIDFVATAVDRRASDVFSNVSDLNLYMEWKKKVFISYRGVVNGDVGAVLRPRPVLRLWCVYNQIVMKFCGINCLCTVNYEI